MSLRRLLVAALGLTVAVVIGRLRPERTPEPHSDPGWRPVDPLEGNAETGRDDR